MSVFGGESGLTSALMKQSSGRKRSIFQLAVLPIWLFRRLPLVAPDRTELMAHSHEPWLGLRQAPLEQPDTRSQRRTGLGSLHRPYRPQQLFANFVGT